MVKLTAKFSFMELHILTPVVVECIANILGDTSEGLTGSEIHKCLLQSGIELTQQTQSDFDFTMLLLKHVMNQNVQIVFLRLFPWLLPQNVLCLKRSVLNH